MPTETNNSLESPLIYLGKQEEKSATPHLGLSVEDWGFDDIIFIEKLNER